MSVGTSMISLDKSNITLGYDANLQKIKNNILNYTSTNRQRSQELIKSVKAKINKENLYQSLKRDLEYHIITNKNFKAYKKYVDKVSGYYEKNKKDIENYCENLKIELKHFIADMNGYESRQCELLEEKEIMIKTNNAILEHKMEEQRRLKEQLNKVSKDLAEQTTVLDEVNKRLEELTKEEENRRQQLNVFEKDEIDKYEELKIKMKVIQNRFDYYNNIEIERLQEKTDEYQKEKEEQKNEEEIDM